MDYFQGYDQLFLKRQGQAGGAASTSADSCDGHDELGCYQVKKKLLSLLEINTMHSAPETFKMWS